jgi:hypothetical protein
LGSRTTRSPVSPSSPAPSPGRSPGRPTTTHHHPALRCGRRSGPPRRQCRDGGRSGGTPPRGHPRSCGGRSRLTVRHPITPATVSTTAAGATPVTRTRLGTGATRRAIQPTALRFLTVRSTALTMIAPCLSDQTEFRPRVPLPPGIAPQGSSSVSSLAILLQLCLRRPTPKSAISNARQRSPLLTLTSSS